MTSNKTKLSGITDCKNTFLIRQKYKNTKVKKHSIYN